MPSKFRSEADRERYIEGRLTNAEQRMALAWDTKERELQAAMNADLIDGFTLEPLDLSSDEIAFSVKYKPQLDQLTWPIDMTEKP